MFFATFQSGESSPLCIKDNKSILKSISGKGEVVEQTWSDRQLHILQAVPAWKATSVPKLPMNDAQESVIVVLWGRIDNREELSQLLNRQYHKTEFHDELLIRLAYKKWGEASWKRLIGEFAFVLYDRDERKLFAIRDPIGNRPLFYRFISGELTISSSVSPFFHTKQHPGDPEPEWMARYLIDISADHQRTPWKSIYKLPPGHALCTTNETLNINRFHDFTALSSENDYAFDDWVQAYGRLLEEAVRCRLPASGLIGCESSGGLDSSTILGMTAAIKADTTDDIHAFGLSTMKQDPQFILETSHYHGIVNNHILIPKYRANQDETLNLAFRASGYPMEVGYWQHCESFCRICNQLNIRLLLSGFGGDEVVTSTGEERILELMQNGQWWQLVYCLDNNPIKGVLRAFKIGLHNNWGKKWQNPVVKTVAMKKDASQYLILNADVAKKWDLRSDYLHSNDFAVHPQSINNRSVAHLTAPYLSTRLENCALIAAYYGIEYSCPLIDQRLLEFYLATPSSEKWHRGINRFLHRRAVEKLLPLEVQWKKDKSMGPVFNASQKRELRLEACVNKATLLLDSLHPGLAELIDSHLLREQVRAVQQGIRNRVLCYRFVRNIRNLDTLNTWLQAYYS
ncbi:asparagine synthase [Oleiphilus messinensis]|uniref:asparagine synthase (glutamine-hydrolyzing) n=1 Tax=Oleiphilus messinensis TaxID=141451 RepID=A0A1Y0ID56_9GAMM|nr:asparagine synthase-related protein [Oleiphilus messinensis]ARU57706.1 asparagine synthase [Oleiphilus messinensis]